MKNSLSFILLILLAGCDVVSRSHVLADVTKSEVITLMKKPRQGAIHSFSITGTGNIEGSAEISLMLNGKPYKTEILYGRVDFQWSGDWYSDEARIIYTPKSVSGGNLKLKYKFRDNAIY